MDRTTLTANFKPLERRGLVDIMVDPTDRRGRPLTMTEAGRALLASAVPIWKSTHRDAEPLLLRMTPTCYAPAFARCRDDIALQCKTPSSPLLSDRSRGIVLSTLAGAALQSSLEWRWRQCPFAATAGKLM